MKNIFCLFAFAIFTLAAFGQNVVVTVKEVNPEKHTLILQPMYPDQLQGQVVSGKFVTGQQLKCKFYNKKTGTKVTVNNKEQDVVINILRCDGGAEMQLQSIMFPQP